MKMIVASFALLSVIVSFTSVEGYNCTICSPNQTFTRSDAIIQAGTVPSIDADITCGNLNTFSLSFTACMEIAASNIPEICGCPANTDIALTGSNGSVATADDNNSTAISANSTSPSSNSTSNSTTPSSSTESEDDGISRTSLILCLTVLGLILAIIAYMVYEYNVDVALAQEKKAQASAKTSMNAKILEDKADDDDIEM